MAHTMFHMKNLPKYLWAEVVLIAIYIPNSFPTRAMKNMTPYEAWFKRKPKVNHFKIFGCIACTHIPKENREKLDKKGENASSLDITMNLRAIVSTIKNKKS